MKKYKELNQIDRYEIQILKEKGYSIRKIAKILKKVRKKQTAFSFSRSLANFWCFWMKWKNEKIGSSWQKGGVENVNKMIRRYIPKGTDISKLPKEYIKWVENKINNKPRKILKYKTALEMAVEHGIILGKVS